MKNRLLSALVTLCIMPLLLLVIVLISLSFSFAVLCIVIIIFVLPIIAFINPKILHENLEDLL
ncbi:MAG: hypothetical protein COV55_02775 [Candidatus Komeilibacteria bacterium CG11_big_fil_rev_8_21_14_0_20_36_20]|uniref:Uncharacterized protein n=1 Tax=Candidatus Komeilibacteria bacterium CG11_big_fil_rev_8_21_14_0_20_36_20 TaxID=1974477 RepID=A0A2H0NEQ3_9BACT|nr:MAG: hypothetical protein COV55_02775 [Candidatus Komeilibacteria bacterium CG11_big_fil_rev_8_21_14_0_20_36_20]